MSKRVWLFVGLLLSGAGISFSMIEPMSGFMAIACGAFVLSGALHNYFAAQNGNVEESCKSAVKDPVEKPACVND